MADIIDLIWCMFVRLKEIAFFVINKLELITTLQVLTTEKGEEGSLLWLLKATSTAFGARLMRHWV